MNILKYPFLYLILQKHPTWSLLKCSLEASLPWYTLKASKRLGEECRVSRSIATGLSLYDFRASNHFCLMTGSNLRFLSCSFCSWLELTWLMVKRAAFLSEVQLAETLALVSSERFTPNADPIFNMFSSGLLLSFYCFIRRTIFQNFQ
jgi:hypothetical protein